MRCNDFFVPLVLCRVLVSLNLLCLLVSQCHNNCNRNGLCNTQSICECFSGWEGNDCARRSCPTGPNIAGEPNGTDSSHSNSECSGRGYCNYNDGTCSCYSGYYGNNCGKLYCMNNCNCHGTCLSLRQAALLNDGYNFNRTTIYTQWDADFLHGCRCDSGWTGADCSQRQCPSGRDPRISSESYEKVTLVCNCSILGCSGKFKPQFYGLPTKIWLTVSSKGYELANAILKAPGYVSTIGGNSVITAYSYYNGSYSEYHSLCAIGETITTVITFVSVLTDTPALSFYAKLITGGTLYYQTTQVLSCDCTSFACNGTFRLSFDGQFTTRLKTWTNNTLIASALNALDTLSYALVTVSILDSGEYPVCRMGETTNTTFILEGPIGNVARLGLTSSVVPYNNPDIYYSVNDTVLKLYTNDGRDDYIKLCNGIGTCDYSRGVCICPFGWGADDSLGPCGKLLVNTSDYGGIGRCPGVVSPNAGEHGELYDYSSRQNYDTRLFISVNPSYSENIGNYSTSTIEYYYWNDAYPKLQQTIRHQVFLNLTSNESAGPLIHDQARNRLLFVDMNPYNRFIGISNFTDPFSYSIWVSLTYEVFGFAMDTYFSRRKVYWTHPGSYDTADGEIYWAYADSDSPEVHRLSTNIGQTHLLRPMGIAIDIFHERIYWVGINDSIGYSVLNSCGLNGSDYDQSYILQSTTNHTFSNNLTDIKINYKYNNTIFIIDKTNPAIIALNLNQPVNYPNDSLLYDMFIGFTDSHILISKWQISISNAAYLALNDEADLVLWSDTTLREINFARYSNDYPTIHQVGTVYKPKDESNKVHLPYYPVGMVLDRGLGVPLWGDYLECYGHGRCMGYKGYWECSCDKGYFGNCNHRTCPTGPAWFHEPVSDNIAHDVYVECSGMGICDRKRGECVCNNGFEGSACERMSCPTDDTSGYTCSNAGRCQSLRDLGVNRYSAYGDPSPLFYGTKPFNTKTWDADMIYGCKADSYGYFHESSTGNLALISPATGYLLNRYNCPKSYNPRAIETNITASTNGSLSYNVQYLTCIATSGYFRLSFRGRVTDLIYHNSTVESLETYLEDLVTIGRVSVSLYYGGSTAGRVCDYTGDTIVVVTFLTELGNIPSIVVYNDTLHPSGTITISPVTLSSSYLYECGGRGECNTLTGVCLCWTKWGSSNGFGSEGIMGDCGASLVY